MEKQLKDCNLGDLVKVWCCGWGRFDTEVTKVIDKSFFVTLQDRNGTEHKYASSALCKVVNF